MEDGNRFSVPDLSRASATCSPKPSCQFLRVGTNGIPRSGYDQNRCDFEPRIGTSWRPFNTDRFVVRSAYGIFYDVDIFAASEFLHSNAPFFDLSFFFNSGVNNIQSILKSPVHAPIASTLPRHYPDSSVQQWNLNLQYQLAQNTVLETGYYGSSGTHLIGFRNINQSQPGSAAPFPQYAIVLSEDKDRSSNYHSLQVRLEQRLSHGLSLLGAYTWAKSIDNGSEWIGSAVETLLPQNSYDLAAERGLSSFQTAQRGVVSFAYQLPLGAGKKFLSQPSLAGKILGNWQVDGIVQAQTGQPFTVNRAGFQSHTSLNPGSDRPDQIADPFVAGPMAGNPDPACHATISQGGRAADAVRTPASWFNACAFSDPNLLGQARFGTAGRNSLIGPGLVQLDLSALRVFKITERQNLQAGAQVFNVLNHPNFDVPVRVFDSANFAALNSANAYGSRPPRQIQVFLRYSF